MFFIKSLVPFRIILLSFKEKTLNLTDLVIFLWKNIDATFFSHKAECRACQRAKSEFLI